jgi:DNA-binding NarL/FixJ family response regulator
MRVILAEHDGFYRDTAQRFIQVFTGAEIVSLEDCGELLDLVQEGSDLRGADVLVMEHYLPLCRTTRSLKEFDERFERLQRDFLDVATVADGRLTSEKAIRWMRSVGVQVPIIIHTNSLERAIAQDVLALSGVSYCHKSLNSKTLCEAITTAMKIR